ncbi:MAG TPA: ATP synthase subunit C [Thiohalobacter sp.]|nr:ATP synthase subunit C [Thiohalobacter sp.]
MRRHRFAFGLSAVALLWAVLGSLLLWLPGLGLAETATVVAAEIHPEVHKWGYMAAALATGLSSLGAGFAVASVGSAAVGAIAEKPEVFGRTLIFVGLAEGIAIYGLIISILILNALTV